VNDLKQNEIVGLEDSITAFLRIIKKPSYWEDFQRRAQVDIDRPSGAILHVLSPTDCNFQSLVNRLGIEAPFVSRKVHELETLGLIERKPSQDKRVHILHLTALGQETTLKLTKAKVEILSEVLEGWSDKEIVQLTEMLNRLTTDMSVFLT